MRYLPFIFFLLIFCCSFPIEVEAHAGARVISGAILKSP